MVATMHLRPLALAILALLPTAGGAAAQAVNCEKEFVALRTDAETKGRALQEAGKRKATPQELCPMFRRFSESEAKLVKFLEQNQAWCQVPAEMIKTVKANHGRTIQLRTRVCQAATAPVAAPPSPSAGLSGLLDQRPSGGLPPTAPSGTGVFDTLTGNILQPQPPQ
jgi:hypothetical protein